MILVLVFFLSKDNKSWELLKPLWNPATSSDNMVFNDLIIHLSWDLVHVWIIWWIISSIVNFKKRSLLSQLLSYVFANIGFISFTFLLVLILLNFNLIFKLFFIWILIIIVYLSFHFWSFVNWLILSLNH